MIICGTTDLTETGRRGGISSRGVWTEIHYEGTVDTIRAALPTITQAWDVEYDLTNPPKGRLIIRTPDYGDGQGEGVVQTHFDLVTNLAQRGAYEHHKSIALGQETIDSIRAGIKANEKPSELTGNASTLYDMIAAGQDSFVSSQFVFRITKTFVNGADIEVAYSSVNRVYTSAALVLETNPTALYVSAISEAATDYLRDTYGNTVPDGHTFGWLKQAPQLQNINGNRSALTIEYWLEAWRNYYYT